MLRVPIRAAFLGWLCALWVSRPTRAEADVFEIPAECGDEARFERALAELLGEVPGPEERPSVQLRRAEPGYSLFVDLPEGPRRLSDLSCPSLFRAATIIVALAVREPQESQPLLPPVAPAASPTQPDSARKRPRGTMLALGLGTSWGLVPSFTGLIELQARRSFGRLGLAGHAWYAVPRKAEATLGQGVRVDAAGLGMAVGLVHRWLELSAGADLIGLRGQGLGVTARRRDFGALGAARLDVAASVVQRRSFALRLTASGLYTPRPARFTLADGERLYTTSLLSFHAGAETAWHFD